MGMRLIWRSADGSDRAKWVEAGDVIMAVDGIRTSELTPSQLLDIFTTFEPGAMVKLQVLTERQGVTGIPQCTPTLQFAPQPPSWLQCVPACRTQA